MRTYRGVAVVATAAAGLFLAALDFSINVALPVMRDSLDATLVTVQGIIIFYHASRSGVAPIAGALIDRAGVRLVFTAGVAAYTAAVALISFQDSLGVVVGLRVLQGVGAAILFTSCPAIVARAVGPERKGLALGTSMAAVSIGQMAATLGGGWLASAVGWESVFYLRVPVGVVILAAGWVTLKTPAQERGAAGGSATLIGLAAAWLAPGLLFTALFLLVLAISLVRLSGVTSGGFLAAAGGAALAFPAYLAVKRQQDLGRQDPPAGVDLRLISAAASNVLVHAGAFITWFLLPFFVTDVLGYGPVAVGSMLAATALATTAGSAAGGWLADRLGDRRVTAAGAVLCGAGLVWVSQSGAATGLGDLGLRLAVSGFGYGIHQAAVYALALRDTPGGGTGAASAALATAQTIGMPLSITVGTALFAWRERTAVSGGADEALAFVSGFEWAYVGAAMLALLAAAPVLLRAARRDILRRDR